MPLQPSVRSVQGLPDRLRRYAAFASFGEDARSAFPHVSTSGWMGPADALRAAINWAWLKWHDSGDAAAVAAALAGVVARGVALYGSSDIGGLTLHREIHDCFLVQAAVLCGRPDVMRSAAEAARPADPRSPRHQFFQAWTGMLRGRVLRDARAEAEQHALFRAYKPDRTYLSPSAVLADAFVARDPAALEKSVKAGAEKHWKAAAREGALIDRGDGTVTVDVTKKHPHFFWPYSEAVFARLAMDDGAEFSYDSFWLPMAFLRALRG